MLYLDYAKQVGDRYILNFFAYSVEDIDEVTNGKEFITKFAIKLDDECTVSDAVYRMDAYSK